MSHGGRECRLVRLAMLALKEFKPGVVSSITGGGGLLWLVLGKGYLLTFPNRCPVSYTLTGCDRVGFSDGEEPPPITCVAARKIVESPWLVIWYSPDTFV